MLTYNPNTPILYILTKIPKYTKRTFNQIRKVKPHRLYLAGDYPEDKKDIKKCLEAREIVSNIDWDCEVKTLFYSENFDRPLLLYKAIDWFFDNEPEGIILDGYIYTSPSFFGFCSQILDKYRDNQRIGHISGGFTLRDSKLKGDTYYFSSLFETTAWASWKRVWKEINLSRQSVEQFINTDFLSSLPCYKPFKENWYDAIKEALDDEDNISWGTKYMYSNIANNRLAIVPNIKFAGYIPKQKLRTGLKPRDIEQINHPAFISYDPVADAKVQEIKFKIPLITKNIPDAESFMKRQILYLASKDKGEPLTTIPKIIHQIYDDPAGPPKNLIEVSRSWRRLHPDWEYRFWNRESMLKFIQKEFPDFLDIYNSFPFNVQRWDSIRYLILSKIGGMYVDFDYDCMEPLDGLLAGHSCCIGMEHTFNSIVSRKKLILGNALMASAPGHPYMQALIDDMISNRYKKWSRHKALQVMNSTGPFLTTRVYQQLKNKDSVTLLPADLVAPLTMEEVKLMYDGIDYTNVDEKIDKAFAIHYFMGSWVPQTQDTKKEKAEYKR